MIRLRSTARFFALLIALAVGGSPASAGKVYRWLDADGNLHFGDRPPDRDTAEPVTLTPINTFTAAPILETSPVTMSRNSTSPRITLYSTPGCGHCKQAKAYMKKKGLAFTEFNILASPKARKQFERLGGRGVPLITIGEQQMNGFSIKAFDQLLKRAGPG